jgi:hypothetical protein
MLFEIMAEYDGTTVIDLGWRNDAIVLVGVSINDLMSHADHILV